MRMDAFVERSHVVGPHAGRVDDGLGANRDRHIVADGLHARPADPPGFIENFDDTRAVRDDRAVRCRGAHDGDHHRRGGAAFFGCVRAAAGQLGVLVSLRFGFAHGVVICSL